MIKLATGKACPRGIITLTRHKSGNYRNDKPAMFSKSLQGLCTVIAKKHNKENNEYSTKRWAILSVFLYSRKQYHIENTFFPFRGINTTSTIY